MKGKNKFGFEPLRTEPLNSRRERAPGPMGTAVREAAESLQETTEAKVEQRRQNAEDAKAYRQASEEGRVLLRIDLREIAADDLPRDRMGLDNVAQSDEMEELKSSIRERGQKEPVELFVGSDGRFQLKKGWRRFTALQQLHDETGDPSFATVIARVEHGQGDRLGRYIDMVEENVVREDLSFAEMAQVAITAAADGAVDEVDPNAMVARLYGALHKTKRSYIRSFVFLLSALGDALPFPKEIARNTGVDVARLLRNEAQVDELREILRGCLTADDQNNALLAYIRSDKVAGKVDDSPAVPRQKFEFFLGDTKVTARNGECRIVCARDFATLPKSLLEDAIKAFEAVLTGGPRIR